jgi:hypothetical protein
MRSEFGLYHGNNVVYLNTNVTIIIRRALEKRQLKHALSHPVRSGNERKVNYGKFRNLLDGVKVIISGSDD